MGYMDGSVSPDQDPGAQICGQHVTAVVVTDADGVITDWSQGARDLLGYSPAEAVGQQVANLLTDEWCTPLRRQLTKRNDWAGWVPFQHQNGYLFELFLSMKRLDSGSDTPRWLLVVNQPDEASDIQKLASFAFTQNSVAQVIFDTELRFLMLNGAAERRIGLAGQNIIGHRVDELFKDPAYSAYQWHLRKVIETGEPIHYEGYYRLPGVEHERPWTHEMGPLKDSTGRLLGVVVTTYESSEQYWGRRRWSLLNDSGTRIGTSLDVSRTAFELTTTVVPPFAEFASVDLLESALQGNDAPSEQVRAPLNLHRIAHHSLSGDSPDESFLTGAELTLPDSPLSKCLIYGRAIIVQAGQSEWSEWLAHDTSQMRRVNEFGFHSALAVPLRARGIALGVLLLLRRLHPEHPYDIDDAVLAEELASRAAVSIDNARRYTRERNTALTLQESLLPHRLAEHPAVDFSCRYLPAGSPLGVGGDWYDVISLSGSRVALVVGDVVGHGIHASATMGRLRGAVRTLADVDLEPDELLTHLDDLVIRLSTDTENAEHHNGGGDVGATCLYAVYDPISRRCSMARAGHPPPALIRPDGSVEFLELPAGPPLGVGGLPFESTQMELPEGSVIALYTDGLVESRRHDVDTGMEKLRESLTSATLSLESKCDSVLDSLLDASNSEDDIALLIARTRTLNADNVATWNIPANPACVAHARAQANSKLSTWGLEDLSFVAELVISELVTNAIRYGGEPIQFRLIRGSTLIIEVSDGSNTAPHLRRARVFDEGGRGLLLVAQMALRWGTRHISNGKTIWAELVLIC